MNSALTIKFENTNDISLITHFHPIVSVKKRKIIGVEALTRGIDSVTGELIPPLTLFKYASEDIDRLIELDRLCRENALIKYKQIKESNPEMLLFINIESSILDKVKRSDYFIDRVNAFGLNPHDIVIEINESKINDISALKCFVQRYRDYGFIIALDDIGAGFSNLNRIPLLSPDIIKIDRFILSGIDRDHYKKEVFKSLVSLASNTGALVVAEGTESSKEAILSTELGADMVQGFYFSKPADVIPSAEIDNSIKTFIKKYKSTMDKNSKAKRVLIDKLNSVSSNIVNKLSGVPAEDMEKALANAIANEDCIECMYVLNKKGLQISDTVFRPDYKRKNESVLFLPASKGTDHSLKGYYYYLVNNKNRNYISHKYMSMASGNMCITLSESFLDKSGSKNILCIDFLAEEA